VSADNCVDQRGTLDRVTARLWMVTRDGLVATCEAVREDAGVQLVVRVAGVQAWRGPVTRPEAAAEWRDAFTARGWRAVPLTETEH
jgi:hypothetical protein